MVRISSVRKALPLPSRDPAARSGRGVRFLRSMPLLPSRYLFETFGLLAQSSKATSDKHDTAALFTLQC